MPQSKPIARGKSDETRWLAGLLVIVIALFLLLDWLLYIFPFAWLFDDGRIEDEGWDCCDGTSIIIVYAKSGRRRGVSLLFKLGNAEKEKSYISEPRVLYSGTKEIAWENGLFTHLFFKSKKKQTWDLVEKTMNAFMIIVPWSYSGPCMQKVGIDPVASEELSDSGACAVAVSVLSC